MTRKFITILAIIVSFAGAAAAQGSRWTERNVGLPVSRAVVSRLSIQPSDGSLFGLTDNGLFTSSDGGEHWRPVSTITGARSLTMDPENAGTIYAVTDHGVVKTTDGGRSWIAMNNGLHGNVIALVIDPGDPITLYTLTRDYTVIQDSSRVFKTSDGAASWNEVQTGLLYGNSYGVALSIGPGSPAAVYLVYGVNNVNQARIASSTDGGATWRTVLVVSNTFIRSLTVDPSSPSTIYATTLSYSDKSPSGRGGILKTTDGGANWRPVTGLPANDSISSLAIDPAAPSTIYATYSFQAGGGMLKSTDGGISFEPIGIGVIPNLSRPAVAIDEANSTVYAFYNGQSGSGIWKSGDGGDSWAEADGDLVYVDASLITVDPVKPSTVYTAAGDTIYQSTDGGSSWPGLAGFSLPAVPRGFGPVVIRSMLVDYFNPSTLYALIARRNGCTQADNLLLKSDDGGATWSDRVSPQASGCWFIAQWGPIFMTMDPTDPSRLYLGEYTEGAHGLTSDGGASWRDIFRVDNDDTPDAADGDYAMAIDPTNSEILYLGLEDYYEGGVRKSVDGGATWVGSGLEGAAVRVMAIAPDGSTIYTSTEGVHSQPAGFRGLFKSTDGGANWSELSQGLETLRNARIRVTAILTGPSNSNTLYLGTAGAGVFRSIDGGATWNSFNDGLGNLNVRVLAMSRNGQDTLYAGTAGGVYTVSLSIP